MHGHCGDNRNSSNSLGLKKKLKAKRQSLQKYSVALQLRSFQKIILLCLNSTEMALRPRMKSLLKFTINLKMNRLT